MPLQAILIILQQLERRRALARLQLGKEIVEAKEMIDRARRRGGQSMRRRMIRAPGGSS
jgi:hypothetical protein